MSKEIFQVILDRTPAWDVQHLTTCNDHSAGEYSLIVQDDSTGCHLTTLSDLVNALLCNCQKNGCHKLILFKSDITIAYHHLILHPLWQIKQIVTVDREHHVDH